MKKYDFIIKEILIEKYKELPVYKIAKEFGCSSNVIKNKLLKYGITIKSTSEQKIKKHNFITKEVIYDLYWNKNKSISDIAAYFGINGQVVFNKMKEFNIQRRSLSEAVKLVTKGKNNPRYIDGRTKNKKCIDCGKIICRKSIRCNKCMGINRRELGLFNGRFSSRWEGGLTSLHRLIRNSFYFETWRNSVLEKDNNICKICDSTHNLEAHHCIKSFSSILSEFLKEYDQFSPIEDKETLVRLATKYKPFWDVNNGKTLCRKCHMEVHKDLINIGI